MNFTPYKDQPLNNVTTREQSIANFVTNQEENLDKETVESFGEEWSKFSSFTAEEIKNAGDQYFDIVTSEQLNKESIVLDLGCGSGRWTKYVANKVKLIEAIDPSLAVLSAVKLNKDEKNVRVTQSGVSNIPFADNTFDFVICLGVLHHIPDTPQALKDTVKKLKPGGTILLYLYYSFENRGGIYKALFNTSTFFRKGISKQNKKIKKFICDLIAIFVYMPFVFLTRFLNLIGLNKKTTKKIPLSYYSDKSFNIIRNDALDRFGTPLEQRFSKAEITKMMTGAGLKNIIFSNNEPYWHMTGEKV